MITYYVDNARLYFTDLELYLFTANNQKKRANSSNVFKFQKRIPESNT